MTRWVVVHAQRVLAVYIGEHVEVELFYLLDGWVDAQLVELDADEDVSVRPGDRVRIVHGAAEPVTGC
jgi:hypothetical protein